jgi:hypothetical protein
MDENKHNLWNHIVSLLGSLFTGISILIGVYQFNSQQRQNEEMELNKNFWSIQNQLYTEICDNAGVMATSTSNPLDFEMSKQKFLVKYYGQMILIEDNKVEESMIDLKYFLDDFDLKKPDDYAIITLKSKILNLSKACKNSSLTFKRKKLE